MTAISGCASSRWVQSHVQLVSAETDSQMPISNGLFFKCFCSAKIFRQLKKWIWLCFLIFPTVRRKPGTFFWKPLQKNPCLLGFFEGHEILGIFMALKPARFLFFGLDDSWACLEKELWIPASCAAFKYRCQLLGYRPAKAIPETPWPTEKYL